MSATFFGILTKIGEAKEANAHALGTTMRITELAVGDGGGVTPIPDREQRALIGMKRRKPINALWVDPNNPNWLIAEQVIPEQEGGWWIRELGLYDQDGDLVAVANCPPTYKPQLVEGSGRTQVVRMVMLVTSATSFEIKIDPAVVVATRQYVDALTITKLDKTASVATLPTKNIGPIYVIDRQEVWVWQSSPYFTGYRSPLCGAVEYGHTVNPLPWQIDAVGQLMLKTAQPRLFAYAQENGLLVASAAWAAGTLLFADQGTQFRLPDLRNMFLRFTGTDVDTANSRAMGGKQGDAIRNITGYCAPYYAPELDGNSGAMFTQTWGPATAKIGVIGADPGASSSVNFDASRQVPTSTENRPINVALYPRLHV